MTLHLGYGRTRAGRAGTGMGFNPYGLRTAKALWHDVGLDAQKIPGEYLFATTQNHHMLRHPPRHIIHKARHRGVQEGSGSRCTKAPKRLRAS